MGEVRPPYEINKAAVRGRNPTGPLGWMQIYGNPTGSTRTSIGSWLTPGWNWTNGNKGEVLHPQRGSPTMVYSPKLIRTPVGLPKISLVKP